MSEERRAVLEHVTIRYLAAGSGPPVLLIHGLGNSVAVWRNNIGPISKNHRTIALDLPGHGLSSTYNGQYNLSFAVEFMGQFLDHLSLPEASLVGSSLGGLVAMRTALKFPKRVRSLVLVGSAGLGREVALFLRLLTLPWLGSRISRPTRKRTLWSLKKLVYNHSFITDDLVDEMYWYRSIPGVSETMLKILRYGVDLRGQKDKVIMLDRLGELNMPTLILWGAQDGILPASHAYNALRRIEGARLHTFDECGHWPHLEKSEIFNSLVVRFLQESWSDASRDTLATTNA
ncbi:MAG: alpha/beta fold hydrolase [Dehalococcoidia bacterium]